MNTTILEFILSILRKVCNDTTFMSLLNVVLFISVIFKAPHFASTNICELHLLIMIIMRILIFAISLKNYKIAINSIRI